MSGLHDWQFQSAEVDWKSGTLQLHVSWESERYILSATGLRSFHLPREFPWGPSNWINEMDGPNEIADGFFELKIEMQSGDVIEVVAETFNLPPAKPAPANAGQLPLGS